MSRAEEPSIEDIVRRVVERLRARLSEIHETLYLRVRDAVPDPVVDGDRQYQAGVLAALEAAVDHALQVISQGSEHSKPIPVIVALQARRAAQAGVSLSTIQRRYIAGHGKLGDLIAEELASEGYSNNGEVVHVLRRRQESLLEHLIAAIEREYAEESRRLATSSDHRRRQTIQRLLAGEPADVSDLQYEINDSWHIGLVAIGTDASNVLEALARRLGCQLLLVPSIEDGTLWAWIGTARKASLDEIECLLPKNGAATMSATLGHPAPGIKGWRVSHRQARAALLVALRKPQPITRCADVALEAALLSDDALLDSLRETYLAPLDDLRIGRRLACETLRHYFRCRRNVSSAATSLGVSRITFKDRLVQIESAVGRPLDTCASEFETLLRLEPVSE